jgi:colicin import membrane protein
MWQIIRENPRAVVYAVLMHLVLLILLIVGLDWTPSITRPGEPKAIQAQLVDPHRLEAIEERKQAEQRKAEAEAKRKAEAKQKAEAEAKRKAEAEAKQKAEAEAKRKAEAEAALQAQLAAEQEARAQGVVAEYVAYIQEKVERNWLRPAGSPAGLSCIVQVKLIPGGDVAGVRIVQGSGDRVFDRSVESAVYKASPLPLPPETALFTYFREINFVFKPG